MRIVTSRIPERQHRASDRLLHTGAVSFAEPSDDTNSDESRPTETTSLDVAAIYLKHHATLRRFAIKFLPSHLKSEADIAIATVFTRLVESQNRGTLFEVENWEAYLIAGVRNACLDIVKTAKNEEELDNEDVRLHWNALPDPTGNEVAEQIERENRWKLLDKALDTLEVRSREIVIEKFANRRSNAEIGKQFDLTGQRVGQLLKQALHQLREELKPHNVE